MKFRSLLLLFLSFIFVSFLLYFPSIKGEFVYDDSFFNKRLELREVGHLGKVWLESLRPDDPNAEVYRPLTVFTYSLNYILFGESPLSFHIVNILLNAVCVFLVYLVTFLLFKNKYLALSTSFLFAFLPIHVEAVANIKSRDDILMAVFSLSSLLVFLKGVEKEKINFKLVFLSSFLFLLSLFSKEFAITFPFLLLMVFLVLKRPGIKNLFKVGLVFGLVDIGYLVLRYLVLGKNAFGGVDPFWYYAPITVLSLKERIFTSFKIFYLYIQKTYLPVNLSATHHFNHLSTVDSLFGSYQAVLGIIILCLFLFLVFKGIRNALKGNPSKKKDSGVTPISLGIIIFLSSYLIFSKFFFASGENFAERWMYLASFGLSLILGYGITYLFNIKKYLGVVVLVLLLGWYGVTSFKRSSVWVSEKALYESMIKDAPDSAQGYIGLSYYYIYKGDYPSTIKYLEAGQKIYHDHPRLLNIETAVALQRKDFKLAERSIARSFEVLPTPISYMMYAIVLVEQGKFENALKITSEYMKSPFFSNDNNKDMNTVARYLTAVSLKGLGKDKEASSYYDLSVPLKGVSPL